MIPTYAEFLIKFKDLLYNYPLIVILHAFEDYLTGGENAAKQVFIEYDKILNTTERRCSDE